MELLTPSQLSDMCGNAWMSQILLMTSQKVKRSFLRSFLCALQVQLHRALSLSHCSVGELQGPPATSL